jgi:PiT family inorganic phosphate transporter
LEFLQTILGTDPLILVTLFVALAFDFVNGFHDAANSIATVVATRVLSPRFAVAWAAFFELLAMFSFGTAVAHMVGTGVVDTSSITVPVVFAGLVGAITWNLITWALALPSSSSHALVGGYVGAAFAKSGLAALKLGGIGIIAAFIFIAPFVGMCIGMVAQILTVWAVRKFSPGRLFPIFRKLQLVSSGIYAFSHGTNDAQKTVGIIFALLLASKLPGNVWGYAGNNEIPWWIMIVCCGFIAAGTLCGGLRIVKTVGTKLTKLDPMHGFCAETGGGLTILGVSMLGIPVSTTHTITGSIIGVGMVGGVRSVRWIIAQKIMWAWIFTIPISAFIGWGLFRLLVALGRA